MFNFLKKNNDAKQAQEYLHNFFSIHCRRNIEGSNIDSPI